RHSQHLRAVQVLNPIALERPKIVGVSELAPQIFKNLPIAVARGAPVCLLEMFAQMPLHAIIVEERVVDVEQEDDVGSFAHGIPPIFQGTPSRWTIPRSPAVYE